MYVKISPAFASKAENMQHNQPPPPQILYNHYIYIFLVLKIKNYGIIAQQFNHIHRKTGTFIDDRSETASHIQQLFNNNLKGRRLVIKIYI